MRDAGFVMDSMVPKCTNCKGGCAILTYLYFSHANSPQRWDTSARIVHRIVSTLRNPRLPAATARRWATAFVTGEHFNMNITSNAGLTTCSPTPREERTVRTCRLCNQPGHKAADCTNDPVTICRNCEKEGHMSRDCPEPVNPANATCRNCDKKGHTSRECPEPRDYSKIQCRNCGECESPIG